MWVTVFFLVSGCADRLPERDVLVKVLERTETALTQTSVRGDVGFLVGQGARLADRQPQMTLDTSPLPGFFKDLLPFEYALWSRRHRELAEIAGTDVRGNGDEFDRHFLADPADKSDQGRSLRTVSLVRDTINCSRSARFERSLGLPDYGYLATHQIWALLLAENQGCIASDRLPELAAPYINRVYNEMQAFQGELNELQVERAAFLSLIGRSDLVPAAMVRELVDTQYGDGLWFFGEPDRMSLSVALRNTAVAYIAVAGALRRKIREGL